MYSEMLEKRVLIFGCGNVLMGDDGFGPAVIKKLKQQYTLPQDAHAEDVGTSVRDLLFNITFLEKRPDHIIVLDAVDLPERRAGEVFEIDIDRVPAEKTVDYSLHQAPTTNLLKELQVHCGVKVTIIAAQMTERPEEVKPGLSKPMRAAVREAAETVMAMVGELNSKVAPR